VTAPTLELRILTAEEVDLAATVEVVNAAFATYEFLSEPRTSMDGHGIEDEVHPGTRFLQLLDRSELVGTACITPGKTAGVEAHEFPGIDTARALYFSLAGVRPGRMGAGIGRWLVDEAERIAREEGFERLILTTIEEMGNVAYYERFGYRSVYVRELPAGYWGLTIPTHYHAMVKELGPRIREARLDEAGAIVELVNLAYEVEDFFKVGPRTDEAEVRHGIERRRILVVDDGGRIVACVRLAIEGDRGHFGMLSVHPDAQGRGLAGALIAHVERTCIESGCRYLDLEYVNLREELPAFYRRFGFEAIGEVTPWPADELHRISRPAHFVTMSKALPEPLAHGGPDGR
jgi:GNAT superfamily N-acetyltransferase